MTSRTADARLAAAMAQDALARFVPLDQWLQSAPRSTSELAQYHRIKAELLQDIEMARQLWGQ